MLHSVRQYKRRIKDWGFDTKYFKHCEMKAIVRKQRQRIAEGKKSVFKVKGRQVEPEKIERADKRYRRFNSPAACKSKIQPNLWHPALSDRHV
jgi:hypothetical protein